MINVLPIKDEKFIVKAERLIIKTIEIHTIKEKSLPNEEDAEEYQKKESLPVMKGILFWQKTNYIKPSNLAYFIIAPGFEIFILPIIMAIMGLVSPLMIDNRSSSFAVILTSASGARPSA